MGARDEGSAAVARGTSAISEGLVSFELVLYASVGVLLGIAGVLDHHRHRQRACARHQPPRRRGRRRGARARPCAPGADRRRAPLHPALRRPHARDRRRALPLHRGLIAVVADSDRDGVDPAQPRGTIAWRVDERRACDVLRGRSSRLHVRVAVLAAPSASSTAISRREISGSRSPTSQRDGLGRPRRDARGSATRSGRDGAG